MMPLQLLTLNVPNMKLSNRVDSDDTSSRSTLSAILFLNFQYDIAWMKHFFQFFRPIKKNGLTVQLYQTIIYL